MRMSEYLKLCMSANICGFLLQVHKLTNQARRQLAKKQIITDDFMADDLPGGVWKVSRTRDVRLSQGIGNKGGRG